MHENIAHVPGILLLFLRCVCVSVSGVVIGDLLSLE